MADEFGCTGILGEIGGKTTTNKWSVVFDPTKREASDIRLYCDDGTSPPPPSQCMYLLYFTLLLTGSVIDARWVQTTPGHWEDKDNQMTLNSQPDCQHTEAGGITYLNRVTPSTQNPKRVVTTVRNPPSPLLYLSHSPSIPSKLTTSLFLPSSATSPSQTQRPSRKTTRIRTRNSQTILRRMISARLRVSIWSLIT